MHGHNAVGYNILQMYVVEEIELSESIWDNYILIGLMNVLLPLPYFLVY